LFWDAQDKQVSFFSVLKGVIREQVHDSNKGSYVMATSGNGRSAQFYMPDWFKTMTRDDVRRIFSEMMDLYVQSWRWNCCNGTTVTYNGAQVQFPANPFPVDPAQINGLIAQNVFDQFLFDCMLDDKSMQRITESFGDWTYFYFNMLNFRGDWWDAAIGW
jgi:hypothetical protein